MSPERTVSIEQPRTVEEYLAAYLLLGGEFVDPPGVKLVLASASVSEKTKVGARDVAVTTAAQCYTPGVALMHPRRDRRSNVMANSTLDAGHLTTRQHVNYTWRFEGVSRSATHDIFHSHPFYNSEQQSQRFVPVVEGSYLIPAGLNREQTDLYIDAAAYANRAYIEMNEWLEPEIDKRVWDMYPPQKKYHVERTQKRLAQKRGKLTQEISRYLLPICQKTIYYHTLNVLQLMRLFRASQMPHFTDETRFVIAKMITGVAEHDPTILDEIRPPFPPTVGQDVNSDYLKDHKKEFDSMLGTRQSMLYRFSPESRVALSDAIRNNIGMSSSVLPDSEAIAQLLDPAKNPYLADVYDIGMFDPATMALRQFSIVFATKLSHTADSQRQRHRMTPGATPPLEFLYDGTPDYITPFVVGETPELKEKYDKKMMGIFERVNRCIEAGVPLKYALTLLPNALTVRTIESGDLFDWAHRWRQRLCYLAQEEIFFISVEQAKQVLEHLPEAGSLFLAPCGIRKAAGVSPRCPEGDRWCGQPVFNLQLDQYKEHRLV